MDDSTTGVSKSLVYLVSPRGGDSYWARTINGCDKIYDNNFGTLAVSIAPGGKYILTIDEAFFDSQCAEMQKLILIHEAGHLAMRHIERLLRVLSLCTDKLVRLAIFSVFNIAADLADNDAIVRNEKEFDAMVAAGKFTGITPENMNLPRGKTMEEYIQLLLKDLNKVLKQMQQLVAQMKANGGQAPGQQKGQPGEEDSEGDDGSGTKKKGKGGSATNSDMDDPTLPSGLAAAAHNNPGLFHELMKAFHELSGGSHEEWNKIIDKLTPEEANSMANKMKQHAKRLIRSAHEQTMRSRGSVPAGIEQLVAGLLAPDQVPWHWLLDDAIAGAVSSKLHEEMAMPNLSLLPDDNVEPWPGFILDPQFNITWITDTSGSVSDLEFARACKSMNALMASNKSIKLRHIQIDATIQHEEMTDNLMPPDQTEGAHARARWGYGGTVYTAAFKRLLGVDTPNDWRNFSERPEENPRPDLIVVFSDAGVVLEGECFPQYKPATPIVWLLAPGCKPVPGMNNTAPDRVIEMFEIKGEFD